MMRSLSILWVCLLLFVGIPLNAQTNARVNLMVKPGTIQLGERANVTLQIDYAPERFQIKSVDIPDSLGVFERYGNVSTETKQGSSQETQFRRFSITGFESGKYELPPLAVIFSLVGSDRDTVLFTQPIIIQVTAPEVDTTKAFKPIQPIEEALLPWQDRVKQYLVYGLIALVVLGLAFGLYRYFKKKKKPQPTAFKSSLSHRQKALERLLILEKEVDMPTQGEKVFYSELIDIFREYVEARFGIPCFDKTSTEMVEAVSANQQLRPWIHFIEALFADSDAVKFAKASTDASTRKQNIQRLRTLLDEIKEHQANPDSNKA